MVRKFFIKTFGCIQNQADSDQIKQNLNSAGWIEAATINQADMVVINSCVVRESAENRVYGLIENLKKKNITKIVVTGCLVGWMKTNKEKAENNKKNFPKVIFKEIKDFDIWSNKKTIIDNVLVIPISFGCNNFCSYCAVPYCRGKEKSRQIDEILLDCKWGIENNIKEVLLVGQNVNSYGADLVRNKKIYTYNKEKVIPTVVNYLGKSRISTLFPFLLKKVADFDFKKISFISSNPWDFSDELIDVISRTKQIDRLIHLPIQSGHNEILKRMNRGYTTKQYLDLVKKIRRRIKGVRISTDIIVGFPGETDEVFNESVKIYKKAEFEVAYINKYSVRSGTLASKLYTDDVSPSNKKRRWNELNRIINEKN